MWKVFKYFIELYYKFILGATCLRTGNRVLHFYIFLIISIIRGNKIMLYATQDVITI